MKKPASELKDDLRPEYDLRDLLKGAPRGKYAKPYAGMVLLAAKRRRNSAQGEAKRNPGLANPVNASPGGAQEHGANIHGKPASERSS
jgi:hypothetical protein